MKDIYTCLWFSGNAGEAVNFYVSIFKNSKVDQIVYYGKDNPHGAEGDVLTIYFTLNGRKFQVINAEPLFTFSEAISLAVACETQAEIDDLWQKLTADGGQEVECGWLKDKYGLSWQITPSIMPDLMKEPDRANRVMAALLKMKKLDIEKLKAA